MIQQPVKRVPAAAEVELVRRALARDAEAFREIMQRHNRRLYRIARIVLRSDAYAEGRRRSPIPSTMCSGHAGLALPSRRRIIA
jgi:hypothetical protein